MLEPQSRLPLQEALFPPQGYVLDYAIGTTFSLNLMTLLTLPLSFTFADGRQEDGQYDPLLLLEGIRRFADRIAVFCQAGQIAVPAQDQLLYAYLESSVVEVVPRSKKGVFHPKVWALRYLPDESSAPDDPVRYRLLVLSRNLTFDRSWDTMLVLDGELTGRKNAVGRLHPLGDFFAEMPNLALRPIKQDLAQRIDEIQYELRRTDFEIPWPFTDIGYYPIGLTGRKSWPFAKSKSASLVVSPFLAQGFLERFGQGCRNRILISRLESLSGIAPEHLDGYRSIYVLSPNADPEEELLDENGNGEPVDETDLSGLHAKLFIEEDGRQATLWTGSANATNAAFQHNVEFMVQLRGKRSQIGIQKLLKEDDGNNVGLLSLLEPYTPSSQAQTADPVQKRLEDKMFEARRSLVEGAIQVTVEDESGTYGVRLDAENPIAWGPSQSGACWPVTLPENIAVPLGIDRDPIAAFRSLSFESITSFFAFELTVQIGDQTLSRRFVQNLPLINPPADRQERLLRSLLKDKNKVLRYLMLLLAMDGNLDAYDMLGQLGKRSNNGGSAAAYLLPIELFEPLVRTLATSPSKLEQVQRLVADLEQTDSIDLLPPDFMEIWPQIWETSLKIPRNVTGTAASETQSNGELFNGAT